MNVAGLGRDVHLREGFYWLRAAFLDLSLSPNVHYEWLVALGQTPSGDGRFSIS